MRSANSSVTWPAALFASSIGLKMVMAVSGAILVGYLLLHFLGNSLIFAGPELLNMYAAKLHATPELLWLARIVLLVAIVAHIASAVRLASANQAARPSRYAIQNDVATTYAARTMIWSGPILLLFVIYHLAHLTFGVTPGEYEHSTTDVYANLVRGFSIPWVAGFYMVANLALGVHLFHGVWSMFQSLGINHPGYNQKFKVLAVALTVLVAGGNITIPFAVLTGIVR